MQTMETKARRHQNDANKDAADPTMDPSIDSDVLRSLVMDVTMERLTAISNAMVPVAATPMTTTYYSAINPYDQYLFKAKTKEGKYWWHIYHHQDHLRVEIG